MGLQVIVASSCVGEAKRKLLEVPFERQTARQLRDEYSDPTWTAEIEETPIAVCVNGEPVPAEQLDEPVGDGAWVLVVPDPGILVAGTGLVVGLVNALLLTIYAGIAYGITKLLYDDPEQVLEVGEESSTTYGWDGIGTNFGPGAPIAIVMGHHRVGGQVLSSQILEDVVRLPPSKSHEGEIIRLDLGLSEGECYRIGNVDAGKCGSSDDHGFRDPFKPVKPLPSEIKINGNLVETDSNWVRCHLRMGQNRQSPMRNGFEDNRTVYNVGQELPSRNPYNYVSSADDIDALGIVLRFPGGLFRVNGNNIGPYPVDFRVSWREKGTAVYTNPVNWRISIGYGTRSALNFVFRVDFPKRAGWEVRVERVTADDDLQRLDNQTVSRATWINALEIQESDLAYPNLCHMGLEVRASERFSNAIQSVTVPLKGILVRRWDGAILGPYEWESGGVEHGRNPAWLLLELLTNTRWGLGRWGIGTPALDLDSFKAWADYCDELVPGPNGNEPRHRCDVVFDRQAPAWNHVLTICRTGRAVPIVLGNTIKIAFDHTKAVSQFFASSAISDVEVTYGNVHDKPNVIDVQFSNDAKDWELDTLRVESDEAKLNPTTLDRESVRSKTVRLLGITRESHARREAIYLHRINERRKVSIKFRAPVVAIAVEVYDRIQVETEVPRWFASSPAPPTIDDPLSGGFRALEAGSTATAIKLDHEVTLAPATTYVVLIQADDDTPTLRTLTDPAGTYPAGTALNFSGGALDWSIDALVAFGEQDLTVKDFIVIEKTTDPQSLFAEISAVEYDPDVYLVPAAANVEQGPGLPATFTYEAFRPEGGLATIPQVAELHATLDEDGSSIRVDWDRPLDDRNSRFRVYVRRYDATDAALEQPTSWERVAETEDTRALIRAQEPFRVYDIAVAVRDRNGHWQSPDQAKQIQYTGEEFPGISAYDMSGLWGVKRSTGIEIGWSPLLFPDIEYYEVRRGDTLFGSELVWRGRECSVCIPDANYGWQTYWIRARHHNGLYSPKPFGGLLFTDTPEPTILFNLVLDLIGAAMGTATRMTFLPATNELQLDDGEFHGTYESPELDAFVPDFYWWSVTTHLRCASVRHMVEDATYDVGGGEARHRLVEGRPASYGDRGADWSFRADVGSDLIDEIGHTTAGPLGVEGENVRLLLQTRFDVDGLGSWTQYQKHKAEFRQAQKCQALLTVERANLDVDVRIPALSLICAI